MDDLSLWIDDILGHSDTIEGLFGIMEVFFQIC